MGEEEDWMPLNPLQESLVHPYKLGATGGVTQLCDTLVLKRHS